MPQKDETRKPVKLEPGGMVLGTLLQMTNAPAMKMAVGAFCEGRALKGYWAIRINSAELVPMPEPNENPEFIPTAQR